MLRLQGSDTARFNGIVRGSVVFYRIAPEISIIQPTQLSARRLLEDIAVTGFLLTTASQHKAYRKHGLRKRKKVISYGFVSVLLSHSAFL